MRILVVTPVLPYPLKSGGQVRIYNLIKELARHNEVSLLSYAEPGSRDYAEAMRQMCKRVEVVIASKARGVAGKGQVLFSPREIGRHLGRARLLAAGAPLGAANLYHPEMAHRLRVMLDEDNYDVVEINFCQMGHYLPARAKGRPVSVLVDIDLAITTGLRTVKTARGLSRIRALVELHRLTRWALNTMPRFDAVATMSDVDARKLTTLNPAIRAVVVPNGVDTSYYSFRNGHGRRMSMVYLGGTGHPPNIDALNYFARRIFPYLKSRCPLATLTVIGEADPERLPLLQGDPAVEFAGFVENVRTRLDSAALMIVPLRVGGGTRLKILEAMAAGVPVLSTPIGCEGIDARPGDHLAVASDEAEFVDLAVKLLEDEEGRTEMAARARCLVEERYSWPQIAADYERRLEEMVKRKRNG